MTPNTRAIRLSLVEDEAAHAAILQRALGTGELFAMGPNFTNGEAAAHYFSSHLDDVPDLILVDLRLPKRNGIEVVQAIRSTLAYQDTMVVMLSTSARLPDIEAAYQAGADVYLVKPFDLSTIRTLLSTIVEHGHHNTSCYCTDETYTRQDVRYCNAPSCTRRQAILQRDA